MKARAKIKLFVDPVNYIHVQDATTAQDASTKLKNAFEDLGFT